MWDHQQFLIYLAMVTLLWPMFFSEGGKVKGDLRCYCNLPVCVATGYMCKSTSGVCFSEVQTPSGSSGSSTSPINGSSRSRHGCVELLHQPRRDMCHKRARNSNKVHVATSSSSTGSTAAINKFPLLMCCREDMCNYVDNLDIKIHVNTKVNHSHSATGKLPSSIDGSEFLFGSAGSDGTAQRDIWFKAAVIAVPIAGAFILILLILLAVHMLRKDNRRHNRQTYMSSSFQSRHQHHLHPHHLHPHHVHHHHVKQYNDKDVGHYLLVSGDMRTIGTLPVTTSKNNANAQLNNPAVVERTRNVYKNVNIVITRDNEFVCDKLPQHIIANTYDENDIDVDNEDVKPLNNAFCNATSVTWAELQTNKSSTPV